MTLKAVRAPKEQFIEEQGFVQIGGSPGAHPTRALVKRSGFRGGSLRVLRKVGKHRDLKFTISTDVPEPFDLYWKIRNTGTEAQQVGALRGELIKDKERTRSRTEGTSTLGGTMSSATSSRAVVWLPATGTSSSSNDPAPRGKAAYERRFGGPV